MHYGREFMEAVDELHAQYDYDPDFWSLTRRLNIPVAVGEYNSAVILPGRPPRKLITLNSDVYYGTWTFTRFHELAHFVLRDSGIEKQLRGEADDPNQFTAWVEGYCNFGAAQFQAPNPMLRRVLGRWGYAPHAVLELADLDGVDLFDAMHRVAHGFLDDDARRTVMLIQNKRLRKCVSTTYFPHDEGQRLPEATVTYPGTRLLTLPERFGWGRVIGVLNSA
jgi:hypothetical protein